MSLYQNNKLLLVHDKRCFFSHWPPASEIGMLLVTNFLELRQSSRMEQLNDQRTDFNENFEYFLENLSIKFTFSYNLTSITRHFA
jgi:hypothetical protein